MASVPATLVPANSLSYQQKKLLELTENLNSEQLDELIAKLDKTVDAQLENISTSFGSSFTRTIGARTLSRISEAHGKIDENALERLKQLFTGVDYPAPITPSEMRDNNVLRGEFNNRSFVILKLELIDPTTRKIIKVVTEIIFQRFSDEDMQFNYVTSHKATDDECSRSLLYSGGSMSKKQKEAVRDLIQGETISSPLEGDNNILLRLAKQTPLDWEFVKKPD